MSLLKDNIQALNGIITQSNLSVNIASDKEIVRKLVHIFEDNIIDPRLMKECKYHLHELLVTIFIAVLHGFNTPTDFACFVQWKQNLLKEFDLFKDGNLPSHNAFRYILMHLDPKELNKATIIAVQNLITAINEKSPEKCTHLEVDGKTINLKPEVKINNVNIYDVSSNVVLMCEACEDKSNEIPKAQEMLSNLDLKKTIITLDAI